MFLKNGLGPKKPTRTGALGRAAGAWLDTWLPRKSARESPFGNGSHYYHGLLGFLALGGDYISRIPIPALAGVTAYVGICLLEGSTWGRLARMRRVDALAFLSTAIAVLLVNAVLAVAIGCSLYAAHFLYARWSRTVREPLAKPALAG